MPGYRGHLAGGVASFILLLSIPYLLLNKAFLLPPFYIGWLLLCSLLGSLFPDIDIKSKGQFWFARFIGLLVLAAIYLKQWALLSGLSVTLLFPLLVHHRGVTHQTWFLVCAPLAMPFAAITLKPHLIVPAFWGYIFFVAGALSHTFLDFGPRNFYRRGLFGFRKWKRRGRWRRR